MDHDLIRLLSRAAHAGTELTLDGDRVRITGHRDPTTIAALRARRDDIHTLLAGPCAHCGSPPWIHEHATGIPWCRPCARHRGHQLLRHEHPHLTSELAGGTYRGAPASVTRHVREVA
jgi:hypothetical protein